MIIYITVFIFGLIMGSFLNVVILRLPRGGTLQGRSECPTCKHILAAKDLVPLLSFVLLRGRCHYCRTAISWKYPLIEAITGVLFVVSYLVIRPDTTSEWLLVVKNMIVVSVAVAVFMIDLEHFLILDTVLLPAALLLIGLVFVLDIQGSSGLLIGYFASAALGAITVALAFYFVWFFSSGKWMGFGDVKLAGFMGLALGFPVVWVALFLACMIGAMVAVPLLAGGTKTLQSKIPFGTFLSVALVISAFYGEQILVWYLGLIGLAPH